MKLELATVLALAASVSAIPVRIITLSGPPPRLAPADIIHNLPPGPPGAQSDGEGMMRILPHPHRPCGGAKMGGRPSSSSSPFADLFERLGLVRPSHPKHQHGHEYDHGRFVDSAIFVPADKYPQRPGHGHGHKQEGEGEKGNMLIEGWKHHVEEMFGGVKNILPIMEGGEVRILSTENDQARPHHGHHGVQAQAQGQGQGQHLRPHGGHHWRHKASSFGSRLHRAMLHLSPAEAITLAFVLGAGIGSIMHLIFMLFLISIRRIRGGGCRSVRSEARRAARRERRQARKAAKAAKRVGEVRLEGEENEEVLPSYEDNEGDRLVEKA